MVEHGKVYTDEMEMMTRFGIFLANLADIDLHNARKVNWTMGVNQFTDLTVKEFED